MTTIHGVDDDDDDKDDYADDDGDDANEHDDDDTNPDDDVGDGDDGDDPNSDVDDNNDDCNDDANSHDDDDKGLRRLLRRRSSCRSFFFFRSAMQQFNNACYTDFALLTQQGQGPNSHLNLLISNHADTSNYWRLDMRVPIAWVNERVTILV